MAKKKVKEKEKKNKPQQKYDGEVEARDDLTAADLVPDARSKIVVYDWSEEDIKRIEGMAAIGLKVSQIAALMQCSLSLLDQRIAADKKKFLEGGDPEFNLYCILEKARAKGDGAIARTCYEVATETRNPTMLIWLSKVRLGWKEHIEISGEVKHTVVYETQLADGIIRQDQKMIEDGEILDAMIEEITEEACPKQTSDLK